MPDQQPKLDRQEQYRLGAPHLLIGDPTIANGDGMMDFGQIPSATVTITPSVASASDVGGHQQAAATYGRGARASVDLEVNDFQAGALSTFIEGASQPTKQFGITAINDTADPPTIEVSDSNDDLSGRLEPGEVVLVDRDLTNGGSQVVAAEVTHASGTTTIPVEGSLQSETISGSPQLTFFYDGVLFETVQRKLELPTLCLIPNENRNASSIIDASNWWFPAVINKNELTLANTDTEGEDANESIEPSMMAHLRKFDQAGTLLPSGARKAFKLSPNDLPGASLTWSLPSTLRDINSTV